MPDYCKQAVIQPLLKKSNLDKSVLANFRPNSKLTAAFDTIDHQILISHLETSVGICGNALRWIKSYVQRSLSVHMGEFVSALAPSSCGVPQGYILATFFFSLYMLPLVLNLDKYGVSCNSYADDTQLYLSFNTNFSSALGRLLACVDEVKA